ncbi:MAG: dihydropteroate synthase [Subdoligranulum sp.]|nr:dihydropteroate synthase [Subdoligranulum sp.]
MNKIFCKDRTLLLDGAMGTMLQKSGLKLGERPDLLSITNPEIVEGVNRAYVQAGSDFICANTFGSNAKKLAGCGYTVEEVIRAGVAAAKRAAAGTSARVILDVGPIGELLEPAGSLRFEEAYEIYKEVVLAGWHAGADLVKFATMTDLYEVKAAILAAKENTPLPVLAAMTFEANGRTFTGCTVEALALLAEGLGADGVGINCSLGPAEIYPLAQRLCAATNLPVFIKPNAGLPDPATGAYSVGPEQFCAELLRYHALGIAAVGGCCGTTPEYIARLAQTFAGKAPVPRAPVRRSAVCTPTRTVEVDTVRVIGERINPTGKKRFQQALRDGDMDYLLAQAVEQANAGAEILDVNVGLPGVDEAAMMARAVKAIQSVCELPLQLDSTKADALEAGLRVYNGKPIVNSVNAEQAVLDRLLPLCKKYGAVVVGLTLDENGIPPKAEARFALAEKIVAAAGAAGIPRTDVYIDCLTLTASAQQEAVLETLQAVRMVKERLGVHTVLGVSNISFGLPCREQVNTTFLTLAMAHGLDLPILNPNSAAMMAAVASFKVLYNVDRDSREYIARYAGQVSAVAGAAAAGAAAAGAAGLGAAASGTAAVSAAGPGAAGTSTPVSAVPGAFAADASVRAALSLRDAVLQGLKAQAADAARAALQATAPEELVNTVLIPALDAVGDGFEKGTLFLPQLLQSAGAAQAAFEVVKDAIAASGNAGGKGKIVIATVKGDIHDIGKNIVKTLLENYGYDMIDLGRDVPPEAVVQAVREHDVRLVGLSALMTTTLCSMEETIAALHAANLPCRVMVGGAVLTPEYAKKIGADYYAKDAKQSVDIAKEVLG